MQSLERAHEGERLWGTKLDAVMAYSAAFTALAQLERGDPTGEVAETLSRVHAEDPRPDGARFWLASYAELALAEGAADAAAISERLEPTRPAHTHPVWAPSRSLRARALATLGEVTEARIEAARYRNRHPPQLGFETCGLRRVQRTAVHADRGDPAQRFRDLGCRRQAAGSGTSS